MNSVEFQCNDSLVSNPVKIKKHIPSKKGLIKINIKPIFFSFHFPFQLVDGGPWGTWGEWRYCPEGYSGANVMQEPPQGVRQSNKEIKWFRVFMFGIVQGLCVYKLTFAQANLACLI